MYNSKPGILNGTSNVGRFFSFAKNKAFLFDKYSETMYDQSRVWVSERDIFPEGDIGDRNYADAKYTPV